MSDDLVRQRDVIDIEAMRRQLRQVVEDIPRVTGHYVASQTPNDPHIFNYLFTAKVMLEQASQLLSHAHLWLLPDDGPTDGDE